MGELKNLASKIIDLIAEVETHQQQKELFLSKNDNLFKKYQAGHYSYFDYEKEQKKLLKDKSKEEWTNGYNAYIYSLLKRIEEINAQLFLDIYNDKSYENIAPALQTRFKFPETISAEAVAPPKRELKKELAAEVKQAMPAHKHHKGTRVIKRIQPVEPVPKPVYRPIKEKKEMMKKIRSLESEKESIGKAIKEKVTEKAKAKVVVPEPVPVKVPKPAVEAPKAPKAPIKVPVKPRPSRVHVADLIDKPVPKKEAPKKGFFKRLVSKIKELFTPKRLTEKEKVEKDLKKKLAAGAQIKSKSTARQRAAPKDNSGRLKMRAPSKSWFDKFIEKTHKSQKAKAKGIKGSGVAMGKFFGLDLIKIVRERSKPVEVLADKTAVGQSTIRLERARRKETETSDVKQQIEQITATALTEEAKRIRGILERRKALRIYRPTFFGALANVTTKKLSLYLLEQFPEFFKELYHALRLANIKILSNTYVNMMVLSVLSSMIGAFFIFGIAFALSGLPFNVVLARTFFMIMVSGVGSFAIFYAYPFSKAKSRRMSINTNMPFAINHMAAVAGAGVAPNKMFKLISESTEYGEIATESEKIVNYIDIFGYDFLTAIRSVAVTTPSPSFREFFNGMISTTQSGGDVKNFLAQKAEESMMTYKLERKKYSETISTYSDIYTGILIAAPLFFVAALSLVGMLGGGVGGTSINAVIVIGTYFVIPGLNAAFITFLKFTQPEV